MSELIAPFRTAWKFFVHPSPVQREIMKESRPFLVFLTVVLVGMSTVVARQHAQFDDFPRLAVFVGLMGAHLFIHWLSGWSSLDRRWSIAYLFGQGLLAAGIVLFTGLPEIGFGLFSALVGETIGIFGVSLLSAAAVIFYLVMQPLVLYLVGGLPLVLSYGPIALSTSLLLVVMMTLIRRSLDAGDRAKELLTELEETHRQLADYAAEVETLTITAERERLARDLHDTLAQGLAGLVMQLEAARHHLGAGNAGRTGEILEQAMDRARTTLEDARRAIDDLHEQPGIGLAALVRQRAERFSDATGIPVAVEVSLPDEFHVDPEVHGHTDRILGESLANIAVHAVASGVAIRLMEHEAGFYLEIEDNGTGFDPDSLQTEGHYGLMGMRERARLAGGSLQVDTAPGRGTRVIARLPAVDR